MRAGRALFACSILALAQARCLAGERTPVWWNAAGVNGIASVDDYAAVNRGQVLHLMDALLGVVRRDERVRLRLRATLDARQLAETCGWSGDDFAAVTINEMVRLRARLLFELIQAGVSPVGAPMIPATSEPAVMNVGQLKWLMCWEPVSKRAR